MSLRALFLDVGDTLLTEVEPRWEIYAQAARARGAEIEAGDMAGLMRAAHHGLPRVLDGAYRYSDPWFGAFIEAIFGGQIGLSPADIEEVTEELFARFESAETFRLFEGAEALLEDLRLRGLVLGIVSNWSARLPRVLAALGLDRAFDFVVCSAIDRTEKPEPEIFRLALERAGVAPSEALHVGDHPRKDVAGARAVGLRALRVDHAAAGGPEPPSERVLSLGELHERLRRELES